MTRPSGTIMRADWWAIADQPDITLNRPGIYEWRIGDALLYIGKSKRLPRRIREYPNNVRKLLAGEPYRKGKPAQYRHIHLAMGRAHKDRIPVLVAILENCDHAILNQRERHWIELRKREQRRGGPQVLNGN